MTDYRIFSVKVIRFPFDESQHSASPGEPLAMHQLTVWKSPVWVIRAASRALVPHPLSLQLRKRRAEVTSMAQCRTSIERHQKSGVTACGMGSTDVPGKKEFGLSAQISSVSGPSGALANCAMREIPTWRTAASYCRKRWMAFQGAVKAPGSST